MPLRPSSLTRAAMAAAVTVLVTGATPAQGGFDHEYTAYGRVLAAHIKGDRVDYRALTADRAELDAAVEAFDATPARSLPSWSRPQQLAFWINAYNAFTLQAVVDHYPVQRRRFSLHPDNSIRQIPGVRDRMTWRAAGSTVTLDEIEHEIIRPTFGEPRIHFAISCASLSCAPLAASPFRALTLDAELDRAARRFLARPLGLEVDGPFLRVSSVFKSHGDDFVERFMTRGPARGSASERAIMAVVRVYGPEDAAFLVESGQARVSYQPHDWALNDVEHVRITSGVNGGPGPRGRF